MNKKANKVKRTPLSKTVRFEIFKRDAFTCQYCGRKAPDVVLHIDHIMPVSQGGTNDIMNLVTSCFDCNIGKSDRVLSENVSVLKIQAQAEMLQTRREQIEMLRDWHLELVDQRDAEVEAVNALFIKLTNRAYRISDGYRQTIFSLVEKYGLDFVLEALRAGSVSYKDPHKALNKLPGICACRADPELNRRMILLNTMHKRFWNFKRDEASKILQRGYAAGGQRFIEDAESLSSRISGTWYQVKGRFYDLLGEWEDS